MSTSASYYPPVTPGRVLMSLIATSTSLGCYIADLSASHVYNPRWPPHAKFHNGQSMSLGMSLGLITHYFIWRPNRPAKGEDADAQAKDSLFSAALTGSLYWASGLSAIWYPGTDWQDPEFGSGRPQLYLFSAHIAVLWLGYWLELRRMKLKKEQIGEWKKQ